MGDPTRLAILSRLEVEGPTSISRLAEPFQTGLPAIMKHLAVLGDAGLVTRKKSGRVVMVSLDPTPLHEAREWIARCERFWAPRLDRLVDYVEAKEKRRPR